MTSLTGLVIGVVLLLFGRRLYWLFVAGVGFLTGLALAPDLLPGRSELLVLLVALVMAIVGALIAVVAQKITIGLIGFVAGGTIGLYIVRALKILGDGPAWVVYLIAGIVGLVLMLVVFDWALIVLSALAGANLIVTGVAGRVHLPEGTWFLLFVALVLVGVILQAGQTGASRRGRFDAPRSGSRVG
jgi:hypothetical protein